MIMSIITGTHIRKVHGPGDMDRFETQPMCFEVAEQVLQAAKVECCKREQEMISEAMHAVLIECSCLHLLWHRWPEPLACRLLCPSRPRRRDRLKPVRVRSIGSLVNPRPWLKPLLRIRLLGSVVNPRPLLKSLLMVRLLGSAVNLRPLLKSLLMVRLLPAPLLKPLAWLLRPMLCQSCPVERDARRVGAEAGRRKPKPRQR